MKKLIVLLLAILLLWSSPSLADNIIVREVNDIVVWAIVDYEAKHIATKTKLPKVTVNIIPWGAYLGFTTRNANEYSIYLRSSYPSVGLTHFVVAHEFGHIWLYSNGYSNTEPNADQFAMCYGSVEAQKYGYLYRGQVCNEPGWKPPTPLTASGSAVVRHGPTLRF